MLSTSWLVPSKMFLLPLSIPELMPSNLFSTYYCGGNSQPLRNSSHWHLQGWPLSNTDWHVRTAAVSKGAPPAAAYQPACPRSKGATQQASAPNSKGTTHQYSVWKCTHCQAYLLPESTYPTTSCNTSACTTPAPVTHCTPHTLPPWGIQCVHCTVRCYLQVPSVIHHQLGHACPGQSHRTLSWIPPDLSLPSLLWYL